MSLSSSNSLSLCPSASTSHSKTPTKPKNRHGGEQSKTAAKCATSRRFFLCAWRAGNALTVQCANQAAPRPRQGESRKDFGGRKRGRTSDLSLVRAALSQLSYPPAPGILRGSAAGVNRNPSDVPENVPASRRATSRRSPGLTTPLPRGHSARVRPPLVRDPGGAGV